MISLIRAVGINMWFNTSYHVETELMDHKCSHHNNKADKQHKATGCKDSCCDNHLMKFVQLNISSRNVLPALTLYSLQRIKSKSK